MSFEWDKSKNKINIEKHGINFEQAVEIFNHTTLTWEDKRKTYDGETREISIGQLNNRVIVTVAHTDRQGITRIISARPSSRKERKRYYDYLTKIIGNVA